jgi:hypothetical protein
MEITPFVPLILMGREDCTTLKGRFEIQKLKVKNQNDKSKRKT